MFTHKIVERKPTSMLSPVLITTFCFLSLTTPLAAQSKYSDWGPAINLGCGTINSTSDDFGPGISKDNLSLYISSNRGGNSDIYVAQRPSTNDPWGSPQNLGPINSPAIENNPTFSRDGHWMFFNSNRPGSLGDLDLWGSYREHVHDDFAWQPPFNLGPGVNTTGFDAGASFFENDDGRPPLLFFGHGLAGPTQGNTIDIWVSELLPDGTFGNARLVPELSSPTGEQRPSIRFDGLEIFFFSNRPGSTLNASGAPSYDIWVATRNSVDDLWNTPVSLGPNINGPFIEANPQISKDGLTLYFASTRPGCGGFDLYMSTRTRLQGRDRID